MKHCYTHGGTLRVYTETPDPARYPAGLALSVHFSLLSPEGEEEKLNGGHGILYAPARIDEQDRISPRSLLEPRLLETEGGWLIYAEEALEKGEKEENGGLVYTFFTEDFCEFSRLGMLSRPETEGKETVLLPPESCEKIVRRWRDPACYPFRLDPARAEGLPYPLMTGYGDPVVLFFEGRYYYLATNDNRDDIGLWIREGKTMEQLFSPDNPEKLLLGPDEKHRFVQTFWAPEFHFISGKLVILFAVSGVRWGPRCHVMRYLGGKLTDPASWSEPVPITKKDGSPLCDDDSITLDMTCFTVRSGTWAVWSYRRFIGTDRDTGSMLYIARLSGEEPSRLDSEPVLLSRPLFGWENVDGTINNEGPYPLVYGGKVYLVYSGGSANRYTYVLGLLTADASEQDLSDPSVWKKSDAPFLCFRTSPGELGPGHHSFFTDEKGQWYIAYHTVPDHESTLRCPVLHRLYLE